MTVLVRPSEVYKDSFIEALREFQAEGKYYMHLDIEQLSQGFGDFASDLLRREDRATQDPDLVPDTFLWLIDNGEYIGRVSIRHELNEFLRNIGGHIGYDIRPSKRMQGYGKLICKLALEEARKLGLEKVLVTCDSANIGSKKIIEANGGILENEIEVDDVMKLRYWITL